MITKKQYLILKFIQPHNILNPIPYIDVLNAPLYRHKAKQDTTNNILEYLSEKGYIKTTHIYPYHISHKGSLSITPSGLCAIEEHQESCAGKRISLTVAVVTLIFSAIAAAPVIVNFIKWLI